MIVFCHLLNDNSGSPVVLQGAIRALTQNGQKAALFVGSQGRGVLETSGVPISRYWYRRSRFRILTFVTFIISQACLYRTLSRSQLPSGTIVYVNTLLPFGAALWARANKCTVVYHAHEVSLTPRFLQAILIWVVQKTAKKVFYVSEEHRRLLPIKSVPSSVITNSIPSRIENSGFSTPYAPCRSGHFQVLMLASPRDFKGVPEFLKLAKDVAHIGQIRFQLVLNGDSEECTRYMTGLGEQPNLEWFHRTDAPEKFYATADIILNLSRVDQWVETFGLTLLEGMAFGLPVIAPPVGGPKEIITQGIDGYMIDSRDRLSLKKTLLAIVEDPQLAISMSNAARQRAAEFTQKRFLEQLNAEIAPLLKTTDLQESVK